MTSVYLSNLNENRGRLEVLDEENESGVSLFLVTLSLCKLVGEGVRWYFSSFPPRIKSWLVFVPYKILFSSFMKVP